MYRLAMFYRCCGGNIDDLTDTVSSYVTFCEDTLIPVKKVVVFPNNKPWLNKDVKAVINRKKKICFSGDLQAKKEAIREVRSKIAKAKSKYREKIEMQYVNGDLRSAWQGVKSMAAINHCDKGRNQLITVNGVDDDCLPDTFNTFF